MFFAVFIEWLTILLTQTHIVLMNSIQYDITLHPHTFISILLSVFRLALPGLIGLLQWIRIYYDELEMFTLIRIHRSS